MTAPPCAAASTVVLSRARVYPVEALAALSSSVDTDAAAVCERRRVLGAGERARGVGEDWTQVGDGLSEQAAGENSGTGDPYSSGEEGASDTGDDAAPALATVAGRKGGIT